MMLACKTVFSFQENTYKQSNNLLNFSMIVGGAPILEMVNWETIFLMVGKYGVVLLATGAHGSAGG